MPDFLLAQDGDNLTTEDGSLIALQSDAGFTAAATVTLRQNFSSNAYYTIGDVPVFTATFADVDGAAVDPTIVVFVWRTTAGVETTYTFGDDDEIDSTGVGVYVFTAPELDQYGKHVCRVDGTDPTAAAERPIGVRPSPFANP